MCLSTHTLFTPSTLVAPSTAGWEQLCRRTPKVLRNPLASAPRKLACLALHMFVCCCSVTVRCHAGMVVLLLLIEVCLEAASAPARHITADFCVDCSIPLPWVVQLRHAWACTPCKPSSSPALWRCSAQHFSLPLLKVCCASGMQGMDVRLRTWLQTRRTGVVQASASTPARPSSPTPHPANPLLMPPARTQQVGRCCSLQEVDRTSRVSH